MKLFGFGRTTPSIQIQSPDRIMEGKLSSLPLAMAEPELCPPYRGQPYDRIMESEPPSCRRYGGPRACQAKLLLRLIFLRLYRREIVADVRGEDLLEVKPAALRERVHDVVLAMPAVPALLVIGKQVKSFGFVAV